MLGEECCIYIPNHTGLKGYFTRAMTDLYKPRQPTEHGESGWLSWFFSDNWKAIPTRLIMVFALVMMVLVISCVLFLRHKITTSVVGQYVQLPLQTEQIQRNPLIQSGNHPLMKTEVKENPTMSLGCKMTS